MQWPPLPLSQHGATTREIIHHDGWKFSGAIDTLPRLAGLRSEGLGNTCQKGSVGVGVKEWSMYFCCCHCYFVQLLNILCTIFSAVGLIEGDVFSIFRAYYLLGFFRPNSPRLHSPVFRQSRVWLDIWLWEMTRYCPTINEHIENYRVLLPQIHRTQKRGGRRTQKPGSSVWLYNFPWLRWIHCV